MIVHTLKICMGFAGPEQSLVLFFLSLTELGYLYGVGLDRCKTFPYSSIEICTVIIFDNEKMKKKKHRIAKIPVLLIFKLYFSPKTEGFVRSQER